MIDQPVQTKINKKRITTHDSWEKEKNKKQGLTNNIQQEKITSYKKDKHS
jgi:hypothetical protein